MYMAAGRCIALALAMAGLLLADPTFWTLHATSDEIVTTGSFQANFLQNAQFTIEAPYTDFRFCIAEYLSLPASEKYSPTTCAFYTETFRNGTEIFNFSSPRSINYSFGLFISNLSEVSITGLGAICPEGTISDGKTCREILGPIEDQLNINLTTSSYFYFLNITDTPHVTGNSTLVLESFTLDISPPLPSPATITTYLRFMGSPTAQFSDYLTLPFHVPSPSPGIYYLYIQCSGLVDPVQVTFQFTRKYATIPITRVDQIQYLSQEVEPDQISYYYLKTDPEQPLWVSLLATNCTSNPSMWVRHDQIPTPVVYEGKDCNQEWCTASSIIFLADSSSVDYFIGVSTSESEVCTYMLWFYSACPRDCTIGNRGSCGDQNQTGVCICRGGWEGPTCRGRGGLASDIISAIIIGSLVGASMAFSLIMKGCTGCTCDICEWLES